MSAGKPAATTPTSLAVSVGASLYYISVSVLLTSSNKLLFDRFPVVDAPALVLGQSVAALAAFLLLVGAGRLALPRPWTWPLRTLVLYLVYLAAYATTIVTALLALSLTSMLMCNTLRRTSIVFVVAFEALTYRAWPSRYTILATALSVYGALHAARGDLKYHQQGYAVAFLANVSSSIYLVMVRPVRDLLDVSNLQLQFLNTVFIIPILVCAMALSPLAPHHSLTTGAHPRDAAFYFLFVSSCLLAMTITHATYISTTVNSAVTHVIAALVKDAILLLVSLLFDSGHDRAKGTTITGVLLSLLGSVVYGAGKVVQSSRDARAARKPRVRPPVPSDSSVKKLN
jgi:hypothetical protein